MNNQGYNVGSNPYADSKGVYWKGNDGKVYVKGAQGVNAAGNWDSNTGDYWFNQGYSQITNPSESVLGSAISTDTPAQTTSTLSGSGGSGQNVALYDQAINQANAGIGRLDQQQQIGIEIVQELGR